MSRQTVLVVGLADARAAEDDVVVRATTVADAERAFADQPIDRVVIGSGLSVGAQLAVVRRAVLAGLGVTLTIPEESPADVTATLQGAG